jgi:hypothetical protein
MTLRENEVEFRKSSRTNVGQIWSTSKISQDSIASRATTINLKSGIDSDSLASENSKPSRRERYTMMVSSSNNMNFLDSIKNSPK